MHIHSASYNICVYVCTYVCALPKYRLGICSFSLFRCPYGGLNSWPKSPERKSALIVPTEAKYVAAAFVRGACKTLLLSTVHERLRPLTTYHLCNHWNHRCSCNRTCALLVFFCMPHPAHFSPFFLLFPTPHSFSTHFSPLFSQDSKGIFERREQNCQVNEHHHCKKVIIPSPIW